MTTTAERLYSLLPAIHRIRDAEQGFPLQELLTLLAEQVDAFEENLEQLYDDQFIETCAPWVTPYIGDLVGYNTLYHVASKVASQRADVANTIRYRRRKGTAAMLEQLARDVTGWPARAVEFFELLCWTQHMNHLRPQAHSTPDLRNTETLAWRDTAFDTLAHRVDVRCIASGAPRHNIPNIGLYLWRVRAFPLTRSPALPSVFDATRCFHFDPLGKDTALYNRPATEDEIAHLAEPDNVPLPFTRRRLKDHLENHYGLDKSFVVELDGDPPQSIPLMDGDKPLIYICDLSDIKDGGGNVIGWAHQPEPGSDRVAVDPVLGRIAFGQAPVSTVLVSYHYGFTSPMGSGEYERTDPAEPMAPVHTVSGGASLQTALDAVKDGGTVQVTDSRRYAETPSIEVNDAELVDGKLVTKTLVMRAANGTRPLLAADGDIALALGKEATFILDGFVISGGTLTLGGNFPCHLILRDCTLVPGPRPPSDGTWTAPYVPGLVVTNPDAKVTLERCITSPLHIDANADISLSECVVDATTRDGVAFRDPDNDLAPGGVLTMESCTVIGKVHARQITLASDCIFFASLSSSDTWKAPLWVERRQEGCVRFSYVSPGSLTPRRYRSQPEGDERILPHFTSLRYGDPGYCQLRQITSDAIRRGAHDESEMGVLHGLYQPQRETNLRVRLEEYLRFGLEAGLVYGS